MFELPDMENVIKVTVDGATVRGVNQNPLSHMVKSHQHQ
jgi:ATP-dependent protease Clp ATPase subunit